MTRELREAIEAILDNEKNITTKRNALRSAYREYRHGMTETAKRIEYLQECLDDGASKRQAARMLKAQDPRISQKTAETLVYHNFSGRYRTTMRGVRKPVEEIVPPAVEKVAVVADIEDDESIL